MLKTNLSNLITIIVLLIALGSVENFSSFRYDQAIFWWTMMTFSLIVFWKAKTNDAIGNESTEGLNVVKWYLIWNMLSVVYGVMVARGYWEWKGLVLNTFVLLFPIVTYIGSNVTRTQRILKDYIRFGLPLFLIVAIFIAPYGYGFYLVPFSFLIIFLPALELKHKLLVILIAVVVLLGDLGARSNIIRFVVPFLLLSIYLLRSFTSNLLLEAIRKFLFILPIVLLLLGTSGVFNIFKIGDYLSLDLSVKKISLSSGKEIRENLSADTRTTIYAEVLNSSIKYNSWLIGRSPARGNETHYFKDIAKITGKNERLKNEVAILNIYTWTGIVGVIFYFFIFYKATFLAVRRSNSIYAKMLGLFLSFRWAYAWVEDINNFNLNYFMLWIMIGLCLSSSFRNMTDEDVTKWIRGVFGKNADDEFVKFNVNG